MSIWHFNAFLALIFLNDYHITLGLDLLPLSTLNSFRQILPLEFLVELDSRCRCCLAGRVFMRVDFGLNHVDYTRGHVIQHVNEPWLSLRACW